MLMSDRARTPGNDLLIDRSSSSRVSTTDFLPETY
jgi:hypothetical protein